MSNETLYMKFLSHFQRGVMRPNKYLIRFVLPEGVSGSADFIDARVRRGRLQLEEARFNGIGSINIKCHTANFPQRNLVTSERAQNSSSFRVPYTQAYDPVTFSFYADADADTRRYFDLWQNTVINVRSNTLNFYNEFTANVEMWNLNEMDQPTYGVRLEEAYPIAVGAMDIAYGNSGTYQTVTTTLQYRRWVQIGSSADNQRAQNAGTNLGG
ncbi:baseplate wedge protein [Xanthomonas phage X1]|nr:baseplate wedge protein [Xanthomonas phage X1]